MLALCHVVQQADSQLSFDKGAKVPRTAVNQLQESRKPQRKNSDAAEVKDQCQGAKATLS